MILECFKEEGRLVYPVFYHVDPTEVRHQKGKYGEDLADLQKRLQDEDKLKQWRLALSQAANLSGYHLQPGIEDEQEYIEIIRHQVCRKINRTPLYVTDYPVGLKSRMHEVISLLDIWSNEKVNMVGICGTGGIGKSTIARAVYNSIADHFDGSCFLSKVRDIDLSQLQEMLLNELIHEKDIKLLGDFHKGIPIIEHRLHWKKFLLVIDDVDKLEQLQALVGRCDWFGHGSRIIITTRNKNLLDSHGVQRIYNVMELNDEEALQLLSWKAFKVVDVDSYYKEVLIRAIHYSCGLPIAIEVIGSRLHGKSVDSWSAALEEYERIPIKQIFEILKLSYDDLEETQKEIFLDLACFFNGEKLGVVRNMLMSLHKLQPTNAIEVLVDRSLIKIHEDRVTMHDLIEDMGKEIVRLQSTKEPGQRDRLWFYEDILHVLQKNTGTDKIEVIILDLPRDKEILWSGKAFMKMKNLKVLVIRNASFSKAPKCLPNSLRVLEWKGYPFKFFPSNFHPTELVHLDLSNSCCQLLQPFNKKFESLSHMDFRNCKSLEQIPDLSGVSNLIELQLDGCTNLIEIHDSVGFLDKLKKLSAMRCTNLRTLPHGIKLKSLEHLNLFGCSSLQNFPQILDKMEKLKELDLDRTAIAELPYSICNLIGLEMLNAEECPNLKQLPTSICMMPSLWSLTANFCKGMMRFKYEGGEETSSDLSTMSSKLEHLCLSNCNLLDGSLAFCLLCFPNMIRLDLSYNNFTTLPTCIKKCHRLRYLLLDNCKHLQHIEGIPPNLEKFSALCCTSLSKSSKSKVLNQVFLLQPGKRRYFFPAEKIPEWVDSYSCGSSMSFWVRNEFPTIFLWVLVTNGLDSIYNCVFSVHLNDIKLDISAEWLSISPIKMDHLYICDLQSIIPKAELPRGNKWNEVKVSIMSSTQETESEREVYFAVHVFKQQNNSENVRFMHPRTHVDFNWWQKAQQQLHGWEELEDSMNRNSNSTKFVDLIENTMQHREQLQGEGLSSNEQLFLMMMELTNEDVPSDAQSIIRYRSLLLKEVQATYIENRSNDGALSFSFIPGWISRVSLCFHNGNRNVRGFVGHLLHSLRERRIGAFMNHEDIQNLKMAIVVLSKDFVSSPSCLDQLTTILECLQKGLLVYPIFYDVNPSVLLDQTRSCGEILDWLLNICDDTKVVEKWLQSLSEVACLEGFHLNLRIANEKEHVERIINEVSGIMDGSPLHVSDFQVGCDYRMARVFELLDIRSEGEVKMVGIYGDHGIGKSTIVRNVCHHLDPNFEDIRFLSHDRQFWKQHGLSDLKGKSLYDIGRGEYFTLGDFQIAIQRSWFLERRTLVIFDDVDELELMRALVGSCNGLSRGSRIIIITRNIELLASLGIRSIYEVEKFSDSEAIELFDWHAFYKVNYAVDFEFLSWDYNFKKYNMDVGYKDILKRVIHYSGGLPLALKEIGSYLRGKTVDECNSTLDEMEKHPINMILCNERYFRNVKELHKEMGFLEEKEPQSSHRIQRRSLRERGKTPKLKETN